MKNELDEKFDTRRRLPTGAASATVTMTATASIDVIPEEPSS